MAATRRSGQGNASRLTNKQSRAVSEGAGRAWAEAKGYLYCGTLSAAPIEFLFPRLKRRDGFAMSDPPEVGRSGEQGGDASTAASKQANSRAVKSCQACRHTAVVNVWQSGTQGKGTKAGW